MKDTAKKRATAKVILGKCPKAYGSSNVFGMRIEEQNDDWVRTWAFKLDEAKAGREGFDTENTRGSMKPATDYPGCPYCGTYGIARCDCGKIFCWDGKTTRDGHTTATCPWCGQTADFERTEKINVRGGGL